MKLGISILYQKKNKKTGKIQSFIIYITRRSLSPKKRLQQQGRMFHYHCQDYCRCFASLRKQLPYPASILQSMYRQRSWVLLFQEQQHVAPTSVLAITIWLFCVDTIVLASCSDNWAVGVTCNRLSGNIRCAEFPGFEVLRLSLYPVAEAGSSGLSAGFSRLVYQLVCRWISCWAGVAGVSGVAGICWFSWYFRNCRYWCCWRCTCVWIQHRPRSPSLGAVEGPVTARSVRFQFSGQKNSIIVIIPVVHFWKRYWYKSS